MLGEKIPFFPFEPWKESKQKPTATLTTCSIICTSTSFTISLYSLFLFHFMFIKPSICLSSINKNGHQQSNVRSKCRSIPRTICLFIDHSHGSHSRHSWYRSRGCSKQGMFDVSTHDKSITNLNVTYVLMIVSF